MKQFFIGHILCCLLFVSATTITEQEFNQQADQILDVQETDLLQKEPISVCGYVGAAATCLIAGTTVADFIYKVSTDAILKYSNRNNCGPIYGQMGSLYYIYRAEGPCATTAILQTVEGALDKHIENSNMCPSQCLRSDHAGDWVGYLTFGRNAAAVKKSKCDSSGTFAYCDSGGNNNLPDGTDKDDGQKN
ncbi:hypothetical protein WALSEDRAFT_70522 [Wallemia mellicola CBS 633.66]|uniref:Secreted protein CSS2 C-terminal domain-containing protein n=1 Tax=Wallemia mellicola (strain ATCC MYA-4683 / CBS 633.66) TaxID=671144 RepID=I4Y696_WALMC|nr:hypothetical protein WALSEDRAFT_70522 [Wallemia mellicola CBS 633.66]EIM19488.1 hypothetical protein WALSEDRAFT_70522 [Wallemia mellicola CBS 633.66]TIC21256.1 hypothetical protein E3Q11_04441 [Wallemia mellicola]|eukprot:XP_006960413.1 hypothetical protein WALSEDRAFT_70522 [Wallemia mellicola CBS 633.66]